MIIGREHEQQLLEEAYNEESSQFVVVYGRRRVGKTFLVREKFNNKFTFQHTGIANSPKSVQLSEWTRALELQGLKVKESPNNWFDAFALLGQLINKSRAKRKVIFIDELPWMDTQGSGFVPALEHFWNAFAAARKDVLMIVCGSATSWIVSKILRNHGGLHNRINQQINLRPFSLHECMEYVKSRKLPWQHRQVLECYMVMGGIPYYWSLLRKSLSMPQNIDYLFFSENAPLADEFDALYRSLFRNPEAYIAVITALGLKKAGMTRAEIIAAAQVEDNGKLTTVLNDLETCGFIRRYNQIGKQVKEAIYQLVDFFTLFYFKFMAENLRHDDNFWSASVGSSRHSNWCGLAFERVCITHIRQIKHALSIGGVSSTEYTWTARKTDDQPGAQIDLLIDRSDSTINLCEMKYVMGEYRIDQAEELRLLNRRNRFIYDTGTSKAVQLTLITPVALARNAHSDIVQNVVTADNLFAI